MNFISLAVSIFITNYIFIHILRLLPIRRNKLWASIIISLADGIVIINYIRILISMFQQEIELTYILEYVGNILGVFIGYAAAMMIILDGVQIFKSKRYREFERGIKQKDGRSMPRSVLAVICTTLFIILLAFDIFTILHYNPNNLYSIIGTSVGAAVSLGFAIYFFLSGKPIHTTLKSSKLLFILQLQNQHYFFKQELSKELTEEIALNNLHNIYLLDEYGLLITPTEKYVIKGIKVNKIDPEIIKNFNMTYLNPSPYNEILEHIQKYNRKKIYIDEQNHVTKTINIK